MGRIGKRLATGILAASIALGTASGALFIRTDNQVKRDPNYVTAVEIDKVTKKVYDSANDLHKKEVGGGKLIPKDLAPGLIRTGPFTLIPGKEEKLLDVEKARNDIKKAVEYLKPIQKEVDSEGKIRDELKEVEKSLPRKYAEESDLSSKEKELYGVASSLSKKKLEYEERAYRDNSARLKYAGSLVGWMASMAGGFSALIKLLNDYEEKKKKQNLEGKMRGTAVTISIIGLVSGLIFLSPNTTGNAIADLSIKSSSWIGAILLVVGLLAGLFWMKVRKNINKNK